MGGTVTSTPAEKFRVSLKNSDMAAARNAAWLLNWLVLAAGGGAATAASAKPQATATLASRCFTMWVGRVTYFTASFLPTTHSKVSFTSSPVLINPTAAVGAGGVILKSVIFTAVLPLKVTRD